MLSDKCYEYFNGRNHKGATIMIKQIPRLSGKEYIALKMLINAGRELYGLEMVEASEGELSKGTVYVTLTRLEEKGYITSRREKVRDGVSIPRRLYKPTGLGARVFRALEGVAVLNPRVRTEPRMT